MTAKPATQFAYSVEPTDRVSVRPVVHVRSENPGHSRLAARKVVQCAARRACDQGIDARRTPTSRASRSPTIRCRSTTPTWRNNPGRRTMRVKLKRMMVAHHGVFIASPEYNASITPLIKNTIDWISRGARARRAAACGLSRTASSRSAALRPGAPARCSPCWRLRQVLAVGCRRAGDRRSRCRCRTPSRPSTRWTSSRMSAPPTQLKTVVRSSSTAKRAGHGMSGGRIAVMLDRHATGLIVALDRALGRAAAEALVERLGESVSFYKIGYQLAFAGGLRLRARCSPAPASRFSSTSSSTTSATRSRGASKASRGSAPRSSRCTPIRRPCMPRSMRASGSNLRLLAVTVLTSYDDADLAAAGYDFTVPGAGRRARRAGARHRDRRARLLGARRRRCCARSSAPAWCW